MNNILKDEDVIQHSRYKIYEKYYGMWNDERVIAFCDSLSDAELLAKALNELNKDKPIEYKYILCREYDEVLDMPTDSIMQGLKNLAKETSNMINER
ncbi:MAG: hypothetical protein IJZ96_00100 [Lachnospiraceae bacterium]|nr:hypothetical protein [Lachnospiraceae bacterium]MBQ8319021.1 hypothetical protein [Lachnospiraceae bacterium]